MMNAPSPAPNYPPQYWVPNPQGPRGSVHPPGPNVGVVVAVVVIVVILIVVGVLLMIVMRGSTQSSGSFAHPAGEVTWTSSVVVSTGTGQSYVLIPSGTTWNLQYGYYPDAFAGNLAPVTVTGTFTASPAIHLYIFGFHQPNYGCNNVTSIGPYLYDSGAQTSYQISAQISLSAFSANEGEFSLCAVTT